MGTSSWPTTVLAVITAAIALGVIFVVAIALRQRLERRKQRQLAHRSKSAQAAKRREASPAED